MEPRVVCYLRVSTGEQSSESQRAQLQDYCDRRGWRQRVGWFSDVGSGAKRDRGALSVLMDEVREGTVDILLTWKIDRLARSLNHLAQIIAELQTHKVALVCPSQGIDTSDGNPCAQFQVNILAAVAQFGEIARLNLELSSGLVDGRLAKVCMWQICSARALLRFVKTNDQQFAWLNEHFDAGAD